MAKNKTKEGPKTRIANRIKAKTVVHTEIKEQVVADPETKKLVTEMLDYVKKMDARSLVMFAKIHNLQQDIATLQNRLKSVVQLLVVRDNPDEMRENEHIIKQFIGGGESQKASVRQSPKGI